jgi:anti-sigma factor RsiW
MLYFLGNDNRSVTMAQERITCQELVELVTAYTEDALPFYERARFEAHLASCSECAIYVTQMEQTRKILRGLQQTAVSPQTLAHLLTMFRAWKQS